MQIIAQNLNLRLPGSTVSPNILDNFSFTAIDNEHTQNTSFLKIILKAASGNFDNCWTPADDNSNEDVDLENNMHPQTKILHQKANTVAQ